MYLLHVNPNVVGFFCQAVNKIVRGGEGVMMLASLFVFLSVIFIVSVLIDKIRIMLWNGINELALKSKK